jgi:GTP-binding protein
MFVPLQLSMADSNFIDYVKIFCRSGKGGDIVLRGNPQMWTLLHLKYRKHIFAEDGVGGSENTSTGRSGESVVLEVPLGTVARDAETGEYIFEITEEGEQKVLIPGGRGGLGNKHFATPINQAPDYAQPGEPCQEKWIILELKILADVGLVGFPNAGKSTLLSVVSAAKPEIANYPFTTLVPNLGVVPYRDHRSFVMADIPGIIEGAHEGRGLGHRFLRHIERNSVLLFLIPADSENHLKEYNILLNELEQFNPELLQKQRLIGISKSDMLDQELETAIRAEFPKDLQIHFFSAVAQKGITELKDILWNAVNSQE